MATATYKDLCIDAVDAAALGRFWAGALRLDVGLGDDGDARLVGPTPGHTVWINTVPEPVTVKQRMHLDVRASVDDVVALGGVVVDDESFPWTVMTDVEGGELCVMRLRDDRPAGLLEIVVDTSDPVRIAPGGPASSARSTRTTRRATPTSIGCPGRRSSGWFSSPFPSPRP